MRRISAVLYLVAAAPLAAALFATTTARAAGALETVAQGATDGLGLRAGPPEGPAGGASVVVAAPFVSDDAAPKGDELALRVAALVAGRIGAGARAQAQTAPLPSARAIAGRARALVYVQTEVAKGDLRTTIDVYPSMGNPWDRIRNPLPSPARHGFATTKIDAEVRAFLAPLLLEQASVDRARHQEGDVLAAACGDVDGDGGNELVLVSAARVAIGRLRGGWFVPERTATWDAIGPALPVPMREPLAVATIVPGGIEVGSTSRGGVRLLPDLTVAGALAGLPVWGGDDAVCLRPEPSAGAFDGAPIDCAIRHDPRPAMAVPAPRFDAFGAATFADAAGNARTVVAVREPSGRLRLKAGDALAVPAGTFGAQVAIGDLDQDGQPDIASSTDLPATGAQPGRPDDAIDIATWTPGDPDLHGRLHLAAPGGVRALAMCPPEEHGQPVLVAIVGGEVWLVRAGLPGAPADPAGDRKAAP
ncbi:MAG TPA: hypothetical protein VH044_18130 [Polyangiaceae bacterium]|jgi:hypothetical protein|nr:hypothetical protein [Polyangiaceae bacterium]